MAPLLSSAFLCPLTGTFFGHIFSSHATSSVLPGLPLQDTPTPFPYPVGFPSMVHRLCAFVCSSVPCELPESQAPFHMSSTLGLLRRRRSPFMSRRNQGFRGHVHFLLLCVEWLKTAQIHSCAALQTGNPGGLSWAPAQGFTGPSPGCCPGSSELGVWGLPSCCMSVGPILL